MTDTAAATVRAAIEALAGATATPSARGVTMYKVMGKIFAILEIRKIRCVILKCDPHLAEVLGEQFAGVGHRSHLDRRFWICVDLEADVPVEQMVGLVSGSYALVREGLTRKQKAELDGADGRFAMARSPTETGCDIKA